MNIIDFALMYYPTQGTWGITKLEDYEKQFLVDLLEHRFTINLHSRQMHITTLYSIYVAYSLIFKKDFSCLYVSNKLESSIDFKEKVFRVLLMYNASLTKPIVYKNYDKRSIVLNNGNYLFVGSSSMDMFRGRTLSTIIIDNAAFHNKLYEFYLASLNTLGQFGSLHLSSQFGNKGNFFNELYLDEKNIFKKNKFHYSLNPAFTPEKIKELKSLLSVESWNQEMELVFSEIEKLPKDKTINFRLDYETYSKVGEKLLENGLSISDYLRNLIQKDIGMV